MRKKYKEEKQKLEVVKETLSQNPSSRDQLQNLIPDALKTLAELVNHSNPRIRLSAAKIILEYAENLGVSPEKVKMVGLPFVIRNQK